MGPKYQRYIHQIRRSAEMLRQVVERLPSGKETARLHPDAWSVQEILIHLRNVALLMHGVRIRRLLYETAPVFGDFDEAAQRRASLERPDPIPVLVEMICTEHEQTARLLSALPEERWQARGTHPELGPMSLEWLAWRMGEHAVEHVRQIEEVIERGR